MISFIRLIPIVLLPFFNGCAKLSYLWDQGRGQMGLLMSGRPNQEILADPQISEETKKKLAIIQQAKDFFYSYFELPAKPIYSKTVMLEGKAVTYLVLATAYDDLELKTECFPFAGCFPYLGFFNLEKAKDYQQKLEQENYVTRIRPVLAYSTLGHFEDPILSSFFYFDDLELVELIFHELFHTIFFVNNEVDLNESLANWMSRALLKEYLAIKKDDLDSYLEQEKMEKQIRIGIKAMATELKQLYQTEKSRIGRSLSKTEAEAVSDSFYHQQLPIKIQELCRPLTEKGKVCSYQQRVWNNPGLAEFLLYEEKADIIEGKKQFGSAKDFFQFLQKSYKKYKMRGQHTAKNFEEYLTENLK